MKFSICVRIVLAAVTLSSATVMKSSASSGDNFELLILHNNDMHARFEQTSQLSGACTTDDREAGKCYGGFPRVAHIVKKARAAAQSGEGPPVLYLNAGDTYTGTAWFTIYKWKIAAEFINALQPDAVCLGNHEFDEAVSGVIPFIRNLNSPVLAANLILDKVPELRNESNLHDSIVISMNGTSIGIIGYLTPETKYLAPRNNVEYEDEIIAIRREVKKLKSQGVKILIALGHSGFLKDIEIAKQIEDIDLVIGGHSNTFLWNSNTTMETPEIPQGPYPTIINHTSGKKVLVVQAYAYTKYLGKLHLVFDIDGNIIKYDGEPVLLNQEVPRDPELVKIVTKYQSSVGQINSEVLGTSLAVLDGECRLRECNIGNLITTAMLNYTKEYLITQYPNVNIAIVQGGRVRASIDHGEKLFNLTRGDLITVLPFSDTLTIVSMNGSVLKQSLEHSVATWRTIDSTGQFLQFAGMEVTYDLAKPPGSRLIKAKAVCSNCGQSKPVEVKDYYEYEVMMPTFLAENGDGYVFDDLRKEILTYNEVECVIDYLKKYSPVNPKVLGRIIVLNEDKVEKPKVMAVVSKSVGSSSSSLALIVNKTMTVYYVICILLTYNYMN